MILRRVFAGIDATFVQSPLGSRYTNADHLAGRGVEGGGFPSAVFTVQFKSSRASLIIIMAVGTRRLLLNSINRQVP